MIHFEIPGIPVPQKQTQFVRKTGIAYDPSKKDLIRIREIAKECINTLPWLCPIETEFSFCLPIPKSASISEKCGMMQNLIPHTKKPDLDNLSYLVTNALKGIIYKDDSQIVIATNYKFYSDYPRTIIKVKKAGNYEM